MDDNRDLDLVIERGRGKQSNEYTVRLNGEVIYLDTVDLTSSEPRRRFIAAVQAKVPSLTEEDLEEKVTELAAQSRRGANQATLLVDLARGAGCRPWHTPEDEAFVTIPVTGHKEHWRLSTNHFRLWLKRLYYTKCRSVPSAQAVQDAIGTLEGQAIYDGPEHTIHLRVAEHGGSVYVDLANADWQAVEVSPKGWQVVQEPPVRFRRVKAMLPLPTPERGGCLSMLRSLVNVPDEAWPLLIGWMLAAIYPRGPYPVLCLYGQQGSAKSTTARLVRALVDPNQSPLRTEPREPRDLMIAANNAQVVAFDNVSHIAPWLSDCLCRLSSGAGFSTRELYSDCDETIFQASRPIILNGIEEVTTRSDLLDRSLLVNLPTIPEQRRRTESDVNRDFADCHRHILGSLLMALSGALGRLPCVRPEGLPRMADFARLVVAGERDLGLAKGEFMAAYTANRDDANALAVEASPIGRLVLEVVDENPNWTGTATELLNLLEERADDRARRSHNWPKNSRALSGALKRVAPNLGVQVLQVREANRNRRRLITLKRLESRICVPCVRNAPTDRLLKDSPQTNRTKAVVMDEARAHIAVPELACRTQTDGADANLPGQSDDLEEEVEWVS